MGVERVLSLDPLFRVLQPELLLARAFEVPLIYIAECCFEYDLVVLGVGMTVLPFCIFV